MRVPEKTREPAGFFQKSGAEYFATRRTLMSFSCPCDSSQFEEILMNFFSSSNPPSGDSSDLEEPLRVLLELECCFA
jgi:hypothetical protein